MDIRYFIDPETRLPHIYRHNLTEEDVENVLRRADRGSPRARRLACRPWTDRDRAVSSYHRHDAGAHRSRSGRPRAHCEAERSVNRIDPRLPNAGPPLHMTTRLAP